MTFVVLMAIAPGGAAQAMAASACAESGAYPTFCSIPRLPTNVKSSVTIHREVIATRLAGRDTVEATAPSTFILDDTAGFAGRAITEAAPPPPVTTPSEADTGAFTKAARAAAKPPEHPR